MNVSVLGHRKPSADVTYSESESDHCYSWVRLVNTRSLEMQKAHLVTITN